MRKILGRDHPTSSQLPSHLTLHQGRRHRLHFHVPQHHGHIQHLWQNDATPAKQKSNRHRLCPWPQYLHRSIPTWPRRRNPRPAPCQADRHQEDPLANEQTRLPLQTTQSSIR